MTTDGRVTSMTRYLPTPEHGTVRDRPVVHRITTSTAAVLNDPSRAELALLLDEVARSGRGSFLIVQCRAGQPDETYLQAVRHAGGWTLEAGGYDGSRHVRAEVEDTALVEDVFMWWTHELAAWRRLPWHPVARDQQWLTDV